MHVEDAWPPELRAHSASAQLEPALVLALLQGAIQKDALVMAGARSEVVLWTKGMEELTGIKAAAVMGTRVDSLFHHWGLRPAQDGGRGVTVAVPGVDGSRDVRWRTFRVRHLGANADMCLHRFTPIEHAEGTGDVDAQLLRYARDLAASQLAKRATEQELKKALDELSQKRLALEEANRKLEHRRDQLSEEVAGKLDLLQDVQRRIEEATGSSDEFHGMRSACPKMQTLFQTIRQVGPTDATVHIWGESGTGKELAARALHKESHRRDGPFVAVNCAALTTTLAESQLFGHVKGAFTGASSKHDGLFVQADGGTLFLDEIAEMPLLLQSKLLRAIQEGEVTPVGASGSVRVDVRIISATHRNLADEVAAGRFREDLMYRLRVVPLSIPALRHRDGDVEVLVRGLLRRANAAGGRQVTSIEPAAVRTLLEHDWPGNVRELENAIQYAFAVGTGAVLRGTDLPTEVQRKAPAPAAAPAPGAARPAPPSSTMSEAERIQAALATTNGRISEAAKLLGMSRATFYRKRQQFGL